MSIHAVCRNMFRCRDVVIRTTDGDDVFPFSWRGRKKRAQRYHDVLCWLPRGPLEMHLWRTEPNAFVYCCFHEDRWKLSWHFFHLVCHTTLRLPIQSPSASARSLFFFLLRSRLMCPGDAVFFRWLFLPSSSALSHFPTKLSTPHHVRRRVCFVRPAPVFLFPYSCCGFYRVRNLS